MPSFTSIAVASLLALSASARPAVEKRHGSGYCLSSAEAQQVATNYGTLIASYSTDLANAALAPSFTDYSESVNSLIDECPQGSAAVNLPLLSPSFTNRSAFELGQGQQAPINFNQLDIWHSCDTVVIRWETTNTANITNVRPVVGIIVMETSQAPAGNQYPYYIQNVYSEFDAAAWLENIVEAGFCPPQSTSGNSTASSSAPASPPTSAAAAPTSYSAAPTSYSATSSSYSATASSYSS
jgi:hypothetical protein